MSFTHRIEKGHFLRLNMFFGNKVSILIEVRLASDGRFDGLSELIHELMLI